VAAALPRQSPCISNAPFSWCCGGLLLSSRPAVVAGGGGGVEFTAAVLDLVVGGAALATGASAQH
jgi:hypothetical protein